MLLSPDPTSRPPLAGGHPRARASLQRLTPLEPLARLAASTGRAPIALIVGRGPHGPRLLSEFGLDPQPPIGGPVAEDLLEPWPRSEGPPRLDQALNLAAPYLDPSVQLWARVELIDRKGENLGALFLAGPGPDPAVVDQTALEAVAQAVAALVQDLTELGQVEAVLRSSEARAHNVVAHAHQAIVTLAATGRITGWNRYAESLFGWRVEEVLGEAVREILAPNPDDGTDWAGLGHFLQTGRCDASARRVEVAALRRDGAPITVELALSAVETFEGREVTVLMHDVSERKAQRELFENAFRHAPIGIGLVDMGGRFVKVNPAFCDLIGYSETELLALNAIDITHPEDAAASREQMRRLREGEATRYRLDKRYVRRDGVPLWTQLSASLVENADGAPRYFIAQVQDVTAQHEAQAALRESEERYRLIAQNTSDMIVASDTAGRITFIAASCEAQTGYGREEMMGRSALEFPYPEDAPALLEAFREVARGEPPRRALWRLDHKTDGRCVWLESNPSLLRDPRTGEAIGFLDVLRDVTEQVAQKAELAAARAQAEAAALVKSEFLANMSHEIRTPLNAILGFTDLLARQEGLDPSGRRFVEQVTSAGQVLLAIVNDILDFSRLEAGQVEIKPSPVRLDVLAHDMLTLFTPQATDKGLALRLDVPFDLPEYLLLDGDRLRQILLNLLGNAVKFTHQGSVRLAVAHDREVEVLTVSVSDTGEGMSPEQQAKLFQRFSQVDASTTRLHGGAGLGLAICKGLTEAMGGSVAVTSQPGQGSTFSFHIHAPVVTDAPPVPPEPEVNGLEGARVLVVDDNPANRELARTVLEYFGASVADAADGRAGVSAAGSECFDVILLDLRMPQLSGAEALAEIRAGGLSASSAILAFTAETEVAVDGTGRGFDGVVRKPMVAVDLVAAVIGCLRRARLDEGWE